MAQKDAPMTLAARLWLLFYTFAKISALVLGGGLAMLPVMEETFVTRKKLLSAEDLLDVVTLTQMVPGIIAANAAIGIGMKIAGLLGALAALAGAVTPPFLIILVIAWKFPGLSPANPVWQGAFFGVRAGVTGLIAVTACKLAKTTVKGLWEAFFGALFLLLALWHFSPVGIILCGIALGLLDALIRRYRKKQAEKRP